MLNDDDGNDGSCGGGNDENNDDDGDDHLQNLGWSRPIEEHACPGWCSIVGLNSE